jgi:hypothetical protein
MMGGYGGGGGYGSSMFQIPGIGGSIALNPFASNFAAYTGGYFIATYGLQAAYAGGSGGYGSGSYATGLDPQQQNFYKAQQAAGLYNTEGSWSQIYDSGNYEKGPSGGSAGRPAAPELEVLQKALAASSEAEVASGEPLNHILAAIQAREAKGAKPVPSAYLAPNLMSEVRFGGTPTGDALNLLRSAGQLQMPAAFDAAPLQGTKEALQRDFAAVDGPLLAGKPVDQAKVTKLGQTVKDAQQKLPAVTRELPPPEASDARRFVSQLESTVKVLKDTGSAGLVNPKWSTGGTSVADLVKHMTKYKLQFGRVDKGNEEVYLTFHRALAGYLFALDRAQAAKK